MLSKFLRSTYSSRPAPSPPHEPTSDLRGDNAKMFRNIIQGAIIRSDPAYRPRPVTLPGYHKFGSGDYDAFVAHSALEAIANKARQAAPNEMIGYVIGRPFRDAKGSYSVVTHAIVAQHAHSGPATVETSLNDERGLVVV